jgi:flagellar protein FliO/FliZ
VETIDIVRFAGALVLVLGLIALAGFLARRLGLGGTGPMRGPRSRRLGVAEAFTLDPKRRLVLVRRDDVEHLLLLGPDTDLVIESGIAGAVRVQPPAVPPLAAPPPAATRKEPTA